MNPDIVTGGPAGMGENTRSRALLQPCNTHSFSVTASQLDALAAVEALTLADGWPPTLREVAARAGLSLQASHRAVVELAARGLLERRPGMARGSRLTPAGRAVIESANGAAA